MNMKSILVGFVFTLSFLLCLSSAKAEILLDFTFLPVDEEFRLPVQQAMDSGKNILPNIERFTVSDLSSDGDWLHAVLVPTSVIEADWETELKSEEIVEVLAQKHSEDSWSAYVWGTEEYKDLLQQAPRNFIAISDADLFSTSIALGQKPPVGAVTYLFPWAKGQCWLKTNGWHYTTALDFAHSSYNAVIASAPGKLTRYCNDGYQTSFAIRHADGGTTKYVHLAANSVRNDLINQNVVGGQFLGLLYNGTAGGYGQYKYSTSCGKGTGMHLHFVLPQQNMTINGYNANNIASSATYTSYCSSNVRVDNGGNGVCGGTDVVLSSYPGTDCPASRSLTLKPGFSVTGGKTFRGYIR